MEMSEWHILTMFLSKILELRANRLSSLDSLTSGAPPPHLQYLGLGSNTLGSHNDVTHLTGRQWLVHNTHHTCTDTHTHTHKPEAFWHFKKTKPGQIKLSSAIVYFLISQQVTLLHCRLLLCGFTSLSHLCVILALIKLKQYQLVCC